MAAEMVTAKVRLTGAQPGTDQEGGPLQLVFQPDYQDGRNKAWATATPALSLCMTVKGPVGDWFEPGAAYTLQIVKSED